MQKRIFLVCSVDSNFFPLSCLYNVYPLIPPLLYNKIGVHKGIPIFFFLFLILLKHRLWVLVSMSYVIFILLIVPRRYFCGGSIHLFYVLESIFCFV